MLTKNNHEISKFCMNILVGDIQQVLRMAIIRRDLL